MGRGIGIGIGIPHALPLPPPPLMCLWVVSGGKTGPSTHDPQLFNIKRHVSSSHGQKTRSAPDAGPALDTRYRKAMCLVVLLCRRAKRDGYVVPTSPPVYATKSRHNYISRPATKLGETRDGRSRWEFPSGFGHWTRPSPGFLVRKEQEWCLPASSFGIMASVHQKVAPQESVIRHRGGRMGERGKGFSIRPICIGKLSCRVIKRLALLFIFQQLSPG